MTRARHWVFTVNNYTQQQVQKLRSLWDPESEDSPTKYLIFQYEKAPDTGTPHLQGYIALTKATRFNQVKNLLPNGAHIEPAKGTPQQCKDYCSKEDSRDPDHQDLPFEEFGTLPPRKGARTDLDRVVEMVRAGSTVRDVAESAGPVFVKYHAGIKRLREVLQSNDRQEPELTYIWGWPGLGKTHFANVYLQDRHGADQVYFKPAGKWWPLYDGQKAVIFDDFTGADCPLKEWNRIFNIIPQLVEVKGGYVPLKFDEAVVTSNFPPELLWPQVSRIRRMSAVRRIKCCIFVYKPDPYCPTYFYRHDPFEIPSVAAEYIQGLEGPQEEVNYLELGARNHQLQLL